LAVVRNHAGVSMRGIAVAQIPSKGDQVEQRRTGISRRGLVWYADHIQVLVKWEDGKSSSLRVGRDRFILLPAAVGGNGQAIAR
jgi:hypothetical protein